MNENEEKKPEQEVTHLEDISGTPTFYRDMAHMSQLMRAVLEAHADKPLVDSVSGEPIPVEMIRAALDRSQEMFSRQEHLLGKSPGEGCKTSSGSFKSASTRRTNYLKQS
jgi:hypothetical protein